LGQGQPDRAARLYGASAAVRECLGAHLPPLVRPGYERAISALRRTLGEQTFVETWAAGRALSREEAIAEALSEPRKPSSWSSLPE